MAKFTLESTAVGCQHCNQDVIDDMLGTEDSMLEELLGLKFEPDNPYDKNAIQVTFRGKKAGYIPKDKTAEAKAFMEAAEKYHLPYRWNFTNARVKSDVLQWFSFTITAE